MTKDSEVDPGTLVEAVLRGDERAADAFYKALQVKCERKARSEAWARGFRSYHHVEEIVQNGMISAMHLVRNRPEEARRIKSWDAWLGRVIKRRGVDEVRRTIRVRRRETSLNQELGEDWTVGDTLAAPGAQHASLVQEEIERCIEKLSKDRQQVMRLYIEGYGNKDIAGMIGKSQNAVALVVYRAKGDLRQCLGLN